MSNTTAVFESSYQPEHIRQELMPIIFGTDAAGEHHSLFRSLQRATLLRDVNAPLYPTEEDEKSLRQREDITKLTWEYEQAKTRSSSPDISRAYATLANRRKQILALMVEKRRGEYLEEVDRRRALGQSIEDIPIPRGTPPAPHPHDQGGYMGRFLAGRDLGKPRRTEIYCRMLVSYLGHRVTELKAVIHSLTEAQTMVEEPDTKAWTCLFCQRTFANRNGLTRHNQDQHFKKGTFDKPIPCPLCPDIIIEGPQAWSNHTAKCHGINYTPWLPSKRSDKKGRPTKTPTTRSARCLFCEQMHHPGNSHSRHVNKSHSKMFKKPFECPECKRKGLVAVEIKTREEWLDHTWNCHQQDGQAGTAVCGKIERKRKRKDNGVQDIDTKKRKESM
ncbi:uncharacterized protein PODANS_6_2430 [Podospora anserina S mat+]|uniref:Podospora anserina S mat+ genomic DNA chromosome 6, supercontig 2 n=1 Tax=Podospora anserina (strain S / ATCC MYA-4624 / DSM 980 / FGSC 10383) TaxID=515849 RepID=B2B2Q2_PODAN|nr:uncharacterized protein PODANS_6_2430 [Podospora anserina S mat+]CAP71387.1 unnamed protein product [Podospora anserina S mat+]CDP30787.1 Putative protein of unknown function [Podospora anserina S mat+]